MRSAVLALHLSLVAPYASAEPSAGDLPEHTAWGWLAEPDASAPDGSFGVDFVPRYTSLDDARTLREVDLLAMAEQLEALRPKERNAAARAVSARLDAVQAWITTFEERSGDAQASPLVRGRLLEQIDLLRMEEVTLQAQLRMLGGNPKRRNPPADATAEDPVAPPSERRGRLKDAIAFGDDVVVGADEWVRDAVSFGGNVQVAGRVERHATAFGGDVHVVDGGLVAGDASAFGGTVRVDPGGEAHGIELAEGTPSIDAALSTHQGPGWLATLAAWLVPFFTLTGAGVLTVGMVPQRVGRVAEVVEDRPLAALLAGMVGGIAILIASVAFAITIIGIPVSLMLLALLGLAWLLGFVGICQAIGDRLPFADQAQGRWLAFLVGAVMLAGLGALPAIGQIVVVAVSLLGVGAALATRLGQPA